MFGALYEFVLCLFFYAINVAAQMTNVKTCHGQNWYQQIVELFDTHHSS